MAFADSRFKVLNTETIGPQRARLESDETFQADRLKIGTNMSANNANPPHAPNSRRYSFRIRVEMVQSKSSDREMA